LGFIWAQVHLVDDQDRLHFAQGLRPFVRDLYLLDLLDSISPSNNENGRRQAETMFAEMYETILMVSVEISDGKTADAPVSLQSCEDVSMTEKPLDELDPDFECLEELYAVAQRGPVETAGTASHDLTASFNVGQLASDLQTHAQDITGSPELTAVFEQINNRPVACLVAVVSKCSDIEFGESFIVSLLQHIQTHVADMSFAHIVDWLKFIVVPHLQQQQAAWARPVMRSLIACHECEPKGFRCGVLLPLFQVGDGLNKHQVDMVRRLLKELKEAELSTLLRCVHIFPTLLRDEILYLAIPRYSLFLGANAH